jgi:Rubicon Homology Domain/RUN domain
LGGALKISPPVRRGFEMGTQIFDTFMSTTAQLLEDVSRAARACVAGKEHDLSVFDDSPGALDLCLSLERIFAHGIRPQYKPPTAEQQRERRERSGSNPAASAAALYGDKLPFFLADYLEKRVAGTNAAEAQPDIVQMEALLVASAWQLLTCLPECLPGKDKNDVQSLCPALYVAQTALENTSHNSPLAQTRVFVRAALNDGSLSEWICALVWNDLGLVDRFYGGNGNSSAMETPFLGNDQMVGGLLDVLGEPEFRKLQFQLVVRDEELDVPWFYTNDDRGSEENGKVDDISPASSSALEVSREGGRATKSTTDPAVPASVSELGVVSRKSGKTRRNVITLEDESPPTLPTVDFSASDAATSHTTRPTLAGTGQQMSPGRKLTTTLSTPDTPSHQSEMDESDTSVITMAALPPMYDSFDDGLSEEEGVNVDTQKAPHVQVDSVTSQQAAPMENPRVTTTTTTTGRTFGRDVKSSFELNGASLLEELESPKPPRGWKDSSESTAVLDGASLLEELESPKLGEWKPPPDEDRNLSAFPAGESSAGTRGARRAFGQDGFRSQIGPLKGETLLQELESPPPRDKFQRDFDNGDFHSDTGHHNLVVSASQVSLDSADSGSQKRTDAWARLLEAEWEGSGNPISPRNDNSGEEDLEGGAPTGSAGGPMGEEVFWNYDDKMVSQRVEGPPNFVVSNRSHVLREPRMSEGRIDTAEVSRQVKFDYRPVSLTLHEPIGAPPSRCEVSHCTDQLSTGLFSTALFCYYCGRYCCKNCHRAERAVVPAYMVRNLDRKPLPVCIDCFQVLDFYYSRPCLLNVSRANPDIFEQQPRLDRVRVLRMQLLLVAPFVLSCSRDRDFLLHQLVGPTRHTKILFGSGGGKKKSFAAARHLEQRERRLTSATESPSSTPKKLKQTGADRLCDRSYMLFRPLDRFSIADLLHLEHLPSILEGVLERYIEHVTQKCALCQSRGFFCSLCGADDLIFPFQASLVFVCPRCRNCFHKSCVRSAGLFGVFQ